MKTGKFQALSDEVDRLVREKKWNEKAFRRVCEEARALMAPDEEKHAGDLLEFAYMVADPSWEELPASA